ncbi:hypothetical protein F2Q69_00044091 [Brassica cretica]|uniref:Uncharacterized protein n=1 Tax=Brassica cretica TaxID=69181 RepID=A0A8S9N5I6_BRACR|nr:hypothetical protein F2Q69_00044091 [Brassica cretica]
MSSPTRIFKILKLIDDSSERFDDSDEIRRLRRFLRRDLMIPATLTRFGEDYKLKRTEQSLFTNA